jgi:hypothetical protein
MRANRLGCLTPVGLLAGLVTLLIIGGVSVVQGGTMFSPGGLSAVTGQPLGGVASHEALGGRCGACHAAPWSPDSMTTRCLACHAGVESELADPASMHGGLVDRAAPLDCRACHTEHHGPRAMLTRLDVANFPHDATGFSLRAHPRHADGALFVCGDCHGSDLARLEPSVCADCHTRLDGGYLDGHVAAFGQACLGCHDGLDRFSSFDHARTAFALTGEHLQATCHDCHAGQSTPEQLHETPSECAACHQADDPHGGLLGSDCAGCHTADGWTPASFDHLAETGFALTGAHRETGCAGCHPGNAFQGTPADCAACHLENDAHQGSYGTDCAACHTPDAWEPATFDHNRTSFPLAGLHLQVECTACHQGAVFRGTPTDCIACHAADDAHNGQLGSDCAACHTAAGWKPATFDHNQSSFPLTGAHQAVACAACHAGGAYLDTPADCYACHNRDDQHAGQFGTDCAACHTTARWDDVTFDHAQTSFSLTGAHAGLPCLDCHASGYQGTPAQCSACHADPPFHTGLFGSDCAACHNPSTWLPAGYSRPHAFPLGHGDANSCRDCHPSSLAAWTCYTCHDQNDIASKHSEEGIGDFTNCLRCHADGSEGDGEGGGGGGGDDDDD